MTDVLQAALSQRESTRDSWLTLSTTSDTSQFAPSAFHYSSGSHSTNGLYDKLGRLLEVSASTGVAAPSSLSDKAPADALKRVANTLTQGDTQGGRTAAQGLLERFPGDSDATRMVGVSYMLEGEYKKAEHVYARAAAFDRDNPRLAEDLSVARTLQGADDEVFAVARRYLDSPFHRSQAMHLLKYLTDRSPDRADAYLALADAFSAEGKPEQALGSLQEALRHADDSQTEEVITKASQLAKDHPQVGLPRNLLGRALKKTGHLDEAISQLKTASDIAPYNIPYAKDLAGAYASRSISRLAAGNTDGAVMDMNSANEISPTDPTVKEATARVDAHRARQDIVKRHYASALGRLASARNKAPDDAKFKKELSSLYSTIAAHYQGSGDDTQALASYTKALELDPQSTSSRKKVAQLSYSLGLEAKTAKRYDRAVNLLQTAYDTYHLDSSYGRELAGAYNLRGELHRSLGEDDLALEDFTKGIKLDPSNASLAANYASALDL